MPEYPDLKVSSVRVCRSDMLHCPDRIRYKLSSAGSLPGTPDVTILYHKCLRAEWQEPSENGCKKIMQKSDLITMVIYYAIALVYTICFVNDYYQHGYYGGVPSTREPDVDLRRMDLYISRHRYQLL